MMRLDRTSKRYEEASSLLASNQPQQALSVLGLLLKEFPNDHQAWNLAGVICSMVGNQTAAVDYFKRAIASGGGGGVWTNLGFAHQKLEQHDLAGRAYKQAIRTDPTLSISWQKLGGLMELQGMVKEAMDCYVKAMLLDPNDLKSLGDALFLSRAVADWGNDRAPTSEQLLTKFAHAQKVDFAPLLLLALPEADAASQKNAGLRFARSQWGASLSQQPLATKPEARLERRLRIGYLSSDFREHALSYLAIEAIAAHDRSVVEVFIYAYGEPTNDSWRAAAIAAGEHFKELEHLSDRAAAEVISQDGIDILVHFNGYTGNGRMGINALRPAPVMVSWLGYMGTLGEPLLADYVIGDAIATPARLAPHFSETLALMPHCYQPNGRLKPARPVPSRESQGLPANVVVFCSFNQTFKLHPAVLDDWCSILSQVPHSVLWLAQPVHEVAKQNLRREADKRGVDASRLIFAVQLAREEHLDRISLADIALDTYPYNSGTTGSDVLRMGVPLLTVSGETLAGRMAASLLAAVGLGDCVTDNRQQYVALAITLGNHPQLRESLRARLRDNLSESTLFRPETFARDLERLYLEMHAQRVAGKREIIRLSS